MAATNDRNEYGSVVPERRHPFRSSTSDVHQVVFRCNGDVQFKDRTVPEEAFDEIVGVGLEAAAPNNGGAVEPAVAGNDGFPELDASAQASSIGFSWAGRALSPLRKAVLQCYVTALKASSVADFYMTKYQSKAQQALSAAMGPITAGLRRSEMEAEAKSEQSGAAEPAGPEK